MYQAWYWFEFSCLSDFKYFFVARTTRALQVYMLFGAWQWRVFVARPRTFGGVSTHTCGAESGLSNVKLE